MTVIVLERVSPGVRGELTRWMLELHVGVFVGRLSALVRDTLWDYLCQQFDDGAGWLVYQTNSEQGYAMRSRGVTNRRITEFDGLMLISIPQ